MIRPRFASGSEPLKGLAAALLLFAAPAVAPAKDVVRLPVPYMAQPDDQTCLPTCLTMTLHFLGRESLTTDTIQRLHKRTRYDRYNLPGIVKDYDLHAFPSWLEHGWTPATVEAELRAGRPVILGVDHGRAGHFVLAIGYTDDGRVILHDPWNEPGTILGGPYCTASWDVMNWRNGAILRTEPFPEPLRAVSGTMETSIYPARMAPGERATAQFVVKNNGRAPWPDEVWLAPVDAYTSPTGERISPFAVRDGDLAWKSPFRVAAPLTRNLAPGETTTFTFALQAPLVDKAVVFRENFNLIDGSGRWFSDHWQTGPSNRQMHMRVAVLPKHTYTWPMEETGTSGSLSLAWETKFGSLEPAAPDQFTTAPPPGVTPLRLLTADQPYDVAWVGDANEKDYKAEAWIYCEYRPQDDPRGWDRVGLFIRDNGHHAATTKGEVEIGGCVAMTYDSDDGKLRAGNIFSGALRDFRPARDTFKITETGWHKFGIRAQGNKLTFELDGQPFHTTEVRWQELADALASGDCGIFYHSTFKDPADRRGIRFAGFRAEK